jgi:hypothetical protein
VYISPAIRVSIKSKLYLLSLLAREAFGYLFSDVGGCNLFSDVGV